MELNEVIPIGVSILDWAMFLKTSSDLFGYSLTKSIDNSGITFSDHAKAVIALTRFVDGEKSTRPSEDLINADIVLNHLSFSFLIYTRLAILVEFNTYSDIKIISSKTKTKNTRLLYASGTLNNWRHFILSMSYNNTARSGELRDIASSCLNFFYTIGLKDLFRVEGQKCLK